MIFIGCCSNIPPVGLPWQTRLSQEKVFKRDASAVCATSRGGTRNELIFQRTGCVAPCLDTSK